MNNCTFCKIIDRKIPGHIITENDSVIVFLSLENHPLVVPKKHIADIYSLDHETGNQLIAELIKTAKAVKEGLQCEGVYITQANEPAAGQDVFHIHFHVYPRWQDQMMNQTERVDEGERQLTLEKIKAVYA
jgi:histidine triad (HIT) family protein